MADTKAVSVRLPLDLLNELNSYATDKGMVRSGDANIGGAIIAILREYFGESDNVVKQVSDNVDIDNKINDAIAPLIARLEALENTHSEAIASEKKAPDTIQKLKGDSNAEITENSIEPDSLPIIEAIENIAAPTVENPDSSNALRDVIASTAKPKPTKRSPKAKAILSRPEALAIAQKFGFNGTGQNIYDWAKAALTAKSEESKLSNREKLAAVGLVAVFTPENKPAWKAKTR